MFLKIIFSCVFQICSYQTALKVRLKIHLKNKHKDLKCLRCPSYAAISIKELIDHIKEIHNGEKQDPSPKSALVNQMFMCTHCTYTTKEKHNLRNHISAVHEKKKPFLCEFCTYAASCRGSLNKHVKLVHDKTKDQLCPYCPYTAGLVQRLNQHINIVHKGLKPYLCDKCSYATSKKKSLMLHIKTVHEETKQFKYHVQI